MNRPVRRFVDNDGRRVNEIWFRRSIEVHRFVDPKPEEFWERTRPTFQAEIQKFTVDVYEENSLVKGFIVWEARGDHIYIRELFVDVSGEKIGTALLDELKSLRKPLCVHVYALNLLTVYWYCKMGFVVSGINECTDDDLTNFEREEERVKYKRQRMKFSMICSNTPSSGP